MPAPITHTSTVTSAVSGAYGRSLAVAAQSELEGSEDMGLPKQRLFQRLADQVDDRGLRRKSRAALLGNLPTVEPDREFTTATRLDIGVEMERVLDERRHTGGAREVVSDLAVTDADAAHQLV